MFTRRAATQFCAACARQTSRRIRAVSRAQHTLSASSRSSIRPATQTIRPASVQTRKFASHLTADEKIEEIQELYATAKDEFEIAAEETEGNTVYAADDRAAAREEFDKLKKVFEDAVNGPDRSLGEEVKSRVGQRIRELENA
ncbi:hypothetical protein LTS18_010728, partial [Coniosporium uncinatum]